MNAVNYQRNGFFVTKGIAANVNITNATPVNIQQNNSNDYQFTISPGVTGTLNFNDASYQANSDTKIHITGGDGLKITSPGVTMYYKGIALVGDAIPDYDGTKQNSYAVQVISSTKFVIF
jgi:hypothetical protein